MDKKTAIQLMNSYGKDQKPFLFVIDYAMQKCIVEPFVDASKKGIFFNFNGISNYNYRLDHQQNIELSKSPISYESYKKAFDKVLSHLKRGNSYLVNLTFETPVRTDKSLKQIFHGAVAKYRLLIDGKLVVFSPETFIKINGNQIFTHPMKGTIDANIKNALDLLLSNEKELAEHATIVDLLRNDLSKIASKVAVEKFRYVDKIQSNQKSLLQVSSKISGHLPQNFKEQIGTMIFEMLPAGSICGAPKKKTVEIIAETENYLRGYYTGVAGYFDGNNLDSCVLIRYIEQKEGKLFYKSGGGITTQSNPLAEYNELIDKIYVPTG